MAIRLDNVVMNSVWILDAIPGHQKQTARWIREDLLDLKVLDSETIRIDKIVDSVDLEKTFQKIILAVHNEGYLPWIHLEAHGSKQGFETANKTKIPWTKFANLCRAVNVRTNMQTLVILAACSGAYFGKVIAPIPLRDSENDRYTRAPCIGLIGPISEIEGGTLQDDLSRFYSSFFSANSMKEALHSLQKNRYSWTTAETFFKATIKSYLKHSQKPKKHVRRVRKEIARRMGIPLADAIPMKQLHAALPEVKRDVIARAWSFYFMFDVYPENSERFPYPDELLDQL